MSPEEIQMHLAAGRYYGKKSACGSKIRHPDELSAGTHASSLNKKKSGHAVEAYPCYWCSDVFPETNPPEFVHLNWHVGREMDANERDVFSSPEAEKLLEMEEIIINVAEDSFGVQVGETTLRVHNRKQCEGHYCSIHNPSDHHMKTWPLNWRSDRGIMERVCSHGTGHPDPDDADYRESRDGDDADPGIHGCDGCCHKGGE